MNEHQHQVALFKWRDMYLKTHPGCGLHLMFAIPNGGNRNAVTGKMLKDEGVKQGIPDIFVDVPRGGFHGLRIELKAPGDGAVRRGVLSEPQLRMLSAMGEQGYFAVTCWGWEAARDTIITYLETQ